MNFFEKLKAIKNFDDTIIKKKEELSALEIQLSGVNKTISHNREALQNINNEIEMAKQRKKQAFDERDVEIVKTKKACEDVIQSYEEKRILAKTNCELIQKEYEQAKTIIDNSLKEVEVNKGRIKLYKAFIKKALQSVEDNEYLLDEIEDLKPTVEIQLNSYDVKDLRALMKENEKIIKALLSKYEDKYTTKSNKAIYQLMVLALRAELQNILVDLKYSNIDKCKENLEEMILKFKKIASDGNQQIAPTIVTFINEIKILFEQALDIEYSYFVRREQEKAEQQALKEQMRQEAEERKALELEQKKVEKEESKYKSEISNTEEQLANCEDDEKTKQLLARIEELKGLLSKVEEKKEEIINRQNGKAGYVYVISNLGSFGEHRFKIGMTRRLEPMERIKELGDASVPFSFDVHSFIFSEDAVGLESELHNRLHNQRTNKINLRKEFFDISIDELEKLVDEICPSAEFKKTMLAIEYKKGLEMSAENNN